MKSLKDRIVFLLAVLLLICIGIFFRYAMFHLRRSEIGGSRTLVQSERLVAV